MSESNTFIEVDKMSIDQLAGSVVLVLGAVGSLLLVIWQSRCACKCRIGCSEKCYLFDCTREPPPEEDKKKDDKKKKAKEGEPEKSPVADEEEQIIPENNIS